MWLGLVGSTETAISLSGAKSCPYVDTLQLMSTAAAGAPALAQRKFSICDFENGAPFDVWPLPSGASNGARSNAGL